MDGGDCRSGYASRGGSKLEALLILLQFHAITGILVINWQGCGSDSRFRLICLEEGPVLSITGCREPG